MNVSKIKLTQGGLKGMVITYTKEEVREGNPYINYHDVEHQAPVPLAIRKLIQKGQQYFADICRLDKRMADPGALRIVEIEGAEGRLRLKAKVMSIDQLEFEMKSPWIEQGSVYSKYEKLCIWMRECYRMAQEYAEKPLVENAKQYLLDLYETPEGKKKLGDDLDIESMDEDAQIAKMREVLESKGMIVLGADDVGVGTAPEDDVATPAETETAGIRVAS